MPQDVMIRAHGRASARPRIFPSCRAVGADDAKHRARTCEHLSSCRSGVPISRCRTFDGARGRDRGACRPRRRGSHRHRARDCRRRRSRTAGAIDRGRVRSRSRARAARRDRCGHRVDHGGSQVAGARARDERSRKYDARTPRELYTRGGLRESRRSRMKIAHQADRRPAHSHPERGATRAQPLGRQPTEGRAREVVDRPRERVYLFDEPTRGIDVGAKAEIYALMLALLARGAGDRDGFERTPGGSRHVASRARHS